MATTKGRPDVVEVHAPADMSNAAFFEAYAAPGRVGLVGGESLIEKAIRHAQRRQTDDGAWSHWGHVFLCEGKRVDGRHWVLESDLDAHRERTLLGVQENPIDKYDSEKDYPYLALLDFGVDEGKTNKMLAEGLRLLADRTQYSLREIAALYLKLRKPDGRDGENALSRGDKAMFCSAFVQHLFLHVGIDFAPDVSTKHTTPEDIAQTPVPHTAYLLLRPKKGKAPKAPAGRKKPA